MIRKLKNIKFTFEAEDLNSFSFLEVKITSKNKRLVTSIFHKATFREVFSNYDSSMNSFTFDTYKVGLVHTLLFPCFKIFPKMENFPREVVELTSIFKHNNYSINKIDQLSKKYLYK